MYGPNSTNSNLITLVVIAVIVVRFLFRELRQRRVSVRTLWIRPGIVSVALLAMIAAAFAIPDMNVGVLALGLVVSAVLGVVTGWLVLRSTTFASSGVRGTVLAQGNATTAIVWVVALALRFAIRYAFAGSGATAAAQFELNASLVALITAAFIVVALGFHRAIDRLAPEASPAG